MKTKQERIQAKIQYLYKLYDLAFEGLDCDIEKLDLKMVDNCGEMIKVHKAIRKQRQLIKNNPQFDNDRDLQELNERLFLFNKSVMFILEKEYYIVSFTVNAQGEEIYVKAP